MNKEDRFKQRFLELLGEDVCKLLEYKHPNKINVCGMFAYKPNTCSFWLDGYGIWSVLQSEYGYGYLKMCDLIEDALYERFQIKGEVYCIPSRPIKHCNIRSVRM